jgi:hypothetical protein
MIDNNEVKIENECWNDEQWLNQQAELSAAENLYEKGLEVG